MIPGLGRSAGEEIGYLLQYSWASLVTQLVKNPGDLGLISGLGRSPGEEKGYPLQYSGLENSMDCIVHRVSKSWTRLRDFYFSHTNHSALHTANTHQIFPFSSFVLFRFKPTRKGHQQSSKQQRLSFIFQSEEPVTLSSTY